MRAYSRANPYHTSIKMSKEEPLKFEEAKGDNPVWGHLLKFTTEEKGKLATLAIIVRPTLSTTNIH